MDEAAATTVTTTGTGSVTAVPDAVRLDLAVRHHAASVAEALAGVASAMQTLGQTARRYVGDEAIATRSLDVDQDYRERGPSGFVATHTVTVLCDGLDRAGDLVGELAHDVGDRLAVHGIRPTLTDSAPLAVAAREQAFADARARADHLAELAGQVVVGAVHVSEGGDRAVHGGPRLEMMAGGTADTRFEPGTASVAAAVTVTWRTAPAG